MRIRTRLSAFIFSLALLLVLPVSAFAGLSISELQYDLPGSDDGREWIEILNDGDIPVALDTHIFFEAGVNHKLVPISGGSILVSQSRAVVAENAARFLEEHPGFGGLLFDSSFSLSNEGEILALKDETLQTLDEVAYVSSVGGRGDGNTLIREGKGFAAGIPSPGLANIVAQEIPSTAAEPKETLPTQVSQRETTKGKEEFTEVPDTATEKASQELPSPQNQTDGETRDVQAPQGRNGSMLPWLLGLFGLVALGIVGVVALRNDIDTEKSEKEVTIEEEAKQYVITEDKN